MSTLACSCCSCFCGSTTLQPPTPPATSSGRAVSLHAAGPPFATSAAVHELAVTTLASWSLCTVLMMTYASCCCCATRPSQPCLTCTLCSALLGWAGPGGSAQEGTPRDPPTPAANMSLIMTQCCVCPQDSGGIFRNNPSAGNPAADTTPRTRCNLKNTARWTLSVPTAALHLWQAVDVINPYCCNCTLSNATLGRPDQPATAQHTRCL
jgi:hypothetical protein